MEGGEKYNGNMSIDEYMEKMKANILENVSVDWQNTQSHVAENVRNPPCNVISGGKAISFQNTVNYPKYRQLIDYLWRFVQLN